MLVALAGFAHVGWALYFTDVLLGHKRQNKSCLLVYIPWESAAALGFRLTPSTAEVLCSPCQAAAPCRMRSAFTERVPKAGERSWREEVTGGGRERANIHREKEGKRKLEESSAEERHEGLAGKQKIRRNGKVAV